MRGGTRDIVVIGGGVVGLACALRLQRSGLSTLVLDPGRRPAPASWGSAGHIAVEQVRPLANPAALRGAFRRLFILGGALDFRLRDMPIWFDWAVRYIAASRQEAAQTGAAALGGLLIQALPAWRRLVDDLGSPELLREQGHLVVWEGRTSARRGVAAWRAADIGGASLRPLADDMRLALDLELKRPVTDGLQFGGTGQVAEPRRLLDLLASTLQAEGGGLRQATAMALPCAGTNVQVALEDGAVLTPGQVLVAGGVGSGALMRTLGHRAPIVAERGYHIEADVQGWDGLPPVVFEDRSMIVTRFGSRLRAASFVEFAAAESAPDRRKWRRLERHVRELGLPMRGRATTWMGSRPTLPDYLPAIGRSARADNLIYAFGHQHLGLTLAPLTAELVADLATRGSTELPIGAFDVSRFDALPSRRASAGAPGAPGALDGVS